MIRLLPSVPLLPGADGAGEEGMVTAEAAVLMPVLACLAGLLLSLLTLAGAQLAIGEGARAVAREVARGGSVESQVAQIQRQWPGTRVRLDSDGESVVVTIERPVNLPGPLSGLLDPPVLTAEATVAAESPP